MPNVDTSQGPRNAKRNFTGKRASRRKSGGTWWTAIIRYGDTLAFSWAVRHGLYRHLTAQVGNTVPVETALDSYRLRLKRRKRVSSEKVIGDISRRMRDGSTLAAALAKWAPADEVAIINSGEMSGDLANSLELLIESKRRVAAVQKAVKSAMTRPIIYVIAIYAFIWALGRFVIPDLQAALPSARATGMVAWMYKAGDLANSWLSVIPPLAVSAAVYFTMASLPRWTGRYRVLAERYFPYSFYRDIQGYAWLMGFTALLRAGMPDVAVLQTQMEHSTPWLRERLHALWWRMDDGASLSVALASKGKRGMPAFGFPNPDIVDDISSMAGFSDFPERITKVAGIWASELEEAMKEKAERFGLLAELVMYGVIVLLLFAVNEMSTQLGSIAK